MRVVLDASVLVSAALSPRGGSGRLVDLWTREANLGVVVSARLLGEVHTTLSRPRFAARLTQAQVEAVVSRSAHYGEFWPDVLGPPLATRDPKDDYLVSLALESQADALVSLDADLLDLEHIGAGEQKIPVLQPGALLARLREAGQA